MSDGTRSAATLPRILLALSAALAGGAYAWWSTRPNERSTFHRLPPRVEGAIAVSNDRTPPSAATAEPVVRALARRSIAVTLASSSGATLRGASLARSRDGSSVQPVDPIGATGAFTLSDEPFASWLFASADGHVPRIVRPDDSLWQDPEPCIRLEPGIDVAFLVEEPSRRAIEGARIRLVSRRPAAFGEGVPADWRSRLCKEVVTDHDGLATLVVPAASDPIEIDVEAFGYGSRRSDSISPRRDGSQVPIELWAIAVAGVEIETGRGEVPPQSIAPLHAAFAAADGLKPVSPGQDDRRAIERRLNASIAGRSVSWMFAIEGPTADGPVVYPQRREFEWRPLANEPALHGELVFRRVADFDPRDVTRIDARAALDGRLATLEVELASIGEADEPAATWGLRPKDQRGVKVRPWRRPDPSVGRRSYSFVVAPGSWVLEPSNTFIDPAPFAARDVELVAGETRRITLERLAGDPAGTLLVELDDVGSDAPIAGWNLQLRSEDRPTTVTIPLEEKRRFRIAAGRYTATIWRAEVASPATPCEIRSGETTTIAYAKR